MSMISALVKRPGEIPRHVNLSNSLEALQRNVGGYIKVVPLTQDLVVICDEEGRLKGKPYNCRIAGVDYVGEIIMCGVDGEEFSDLPLPWKDMKDVFRRLWEVSK